MSNENDVEIHQGYRELLAQHDLLLIKYKAAQDLVSDIVGFDRDNGVHDVGTMADRIDALLADQMPVPQQTNWPDQCPITRRDFFMEIDGVPTYGGPYDSYTIPEMLGTPDQPLHERELFVRRYDHDLGGWLMDSVEVIPLRIINDEVLMELEEKAEKASPNAFSLESWQPIETAPKDGSEILLFYPIGAFPRELVEKGFWNSDRYASNPKPYWGNSSERIWGTKRCRQNQPTHWMPIPSAPKPQGEDLAPEPRITQPARIGGVVFQPGIKVASVIEAAYRAAEDHEPNPAAFQALRAAIAPEQSGGRTITEDQEDELTAVLESIAKGLCDDPARDASFLLKRITADWWGQQQGGEPCATASPSSNEG